MGIRKPAANGYRMLWVEYVGCGGVVNNYGFPKVTANLGEILYTCQQ